MKHTLSGWLFLLLWLQSAAYAAGFTGPGQTHYIEVSVDRSSLAPNSFGIGPQIGGPFTATIYVRAFKVDGTVLNSTEEVVGMSLRSLNLGALYYLDGDTDHEDEETGLPLAFRSTTHGLNSGVASAHFHAGDTPGTALIDISVQDPNGVGPTQSATVQITIERGGSTGTVGAILIDDTTTSGVVYTAGIGQVDQRFLQGNLFDDAFLAMPNPTGAFDNVELSIITGPNGGEHLAAQSTTQGTMTGKTVHTRTVNGIFQFTLRSGTLPGTVTVRARADRADNNVSNGLQSPVVDDAVFVIDDGVVRSVSVAGPFVDAVAANSQSLVVDGGDTLTADGIYSRSIQLITSTRFGQVPPVGTPMTIFLGDGPFIPDTYPNCGHGEFRYQGLDANPTEGGNTLSIPVGTRSFGGVQAGCIIFLRGPHPDHYIPRIITGMLSPYQVQVGQTFPAVADTGFGDAYIVTCPPYFGNVDSNPSVTGTNGNGAVLATDGKGSVIFNINYPASQIGRNFVIGAEVNGGAVNGTAVTHYLGVPNGATFSVLTPTLELLAGSTYTLPVAPGGNSTVPLVLQLQDGSAVSTGGVVTAPIPGEAITADIEVIDPDHEAALAARQLADAAAAFVAQIRAQATAARDTADATGTASCQAAAALIRLPVSTTFPAASLPANVCGTPAVGETITVGAATLGDPAAAQAAAQTAARAAAAATCGTVAQHPGQTLCDNTLTYDYSYEVDVTVSCTSSTTGGFTVPVTLTVFVNGSTLTDFLDAPSTSLCAVATQIETEAQTAEVNAASLEADADAAEGIDALHNPTATVTDSTGKACGLFTNNSGRVSVQINVADLPNSGRVIARFYPVDFPVTDIVEVQLECGQRDVVNGVEACTVLTATDVQGNAAP